MKKQVEVLIPKLLQNLINMGVDLRGLAFEYTAECKSFAMTKGLIIYLCPQIILRNLTETDQTSALAHEVYHTRNDTPYEPVIKQGNFTVPITYEQMPQNIKDMVLEDWNAYNKDATGKITLAEYINNVYANITKLNPMEFYYNECRAYEYQFSLNLQLSDSYRKGIQHTYWKYKYIHEHYDEILQSNH